LDIHVAARHIPALDLISASDPMCVLFLPVAGQYREIARTEAISNNANPNWVKFFQATYIFEAQQPLRFQVYDVDSDSPLLEKHDFVGFADTTMQQIAAHRGQELVLPLRHPKKSGNRGDLLINTEQAAICGSIVQGIVRCNNLKKMHTFSRNNPFFMLEKPSESGRDLPIYRSEVLAKTYQGTWKEFSIPLGSLTGGDLNAPVTISVYDFLARKAPLKIGAVQGSLSHFMEHLNQNEALVDEKRKGAGFVTFSSLQVIRRPTFCDYLAGGLQLNLITAIDFTGSNGDPRMPTSLHYGAPNQMNQYERCMWEVGSIVCPYDSDQLFPVYGFGGIPPNEKFANHCFPLTLDPAQPNVSGLNGIIGVYKNALRCVSLSGPTLFAPVIRAATQVAIASFQQHTYTILLIITDGCINDMQDTVDAIVAACDAPLSILIVGVGPASFRAMKVLDADDEPLRSSRGVQARRDIVQFVPFSQFTATQFSLAQELLAEVPKQVDDFCSSHGFVPRF
jgi:hypothetical protein